MGIGYQSVDRHVIDYDLWFMPGSNLALRGPRQDPRKLDMAMTVCCIGAAQTFGRFVHRPYPDQIGSILQLPVLNLGVSGAGPEFYLEKPPLMDLLRRAGIVVVQCMSARSVTAGRFKAGGNNGVLKFVDGPRRGEQKLAEEAYRLLRAEYGEEAFQEQIATVQTQWLALHRELTAQISGRKVFLWLSSKKPGENIELAQSPVGTFPHFVSVEMMEEIGTLFDDVVECVCPHMPAQILINDVTGVIEPVFTAERFPHRPGHLQCVNTYYATPALHDQAAGELCRTLLASTAPRGA